MIDLVGRARRLDCSPVTSGSKRGVCSLDTLLCKKRGVQRRVTWLVAITSPLVLSCSCESSVCGIIGWILPFCCPVFLRCSRGTTSYQWGMVREYRLRTQNTTASHTPSLRSLFCAHYHSLADLIHRPSAYPSGVTVDTTARYQQGDSRLTNLLAKASVTQPTAATPLPETT